MVGSRARRKLAAPRMGDLVPRTGRVTEPFGHDARGLLVYADDGYMSVVLRRAERIAGRARGATLGVLEQAQGFTSYVSYAGPWRVEGGEVVNSVEHALHPDLVGTEQRRRVTLSGDEMVLTGDERSAAAGALRAHGPASWSRSSSPRPAGMDAHGPAGNRDCYRQAVEEAGRRPPGGTGRGGAARGRSARATISRRPKDRRAHVGLAVARHRAPPARAGPAPAAFGYSACVAPCPPCSPPRTWGTLLLSADRRGRRRRRGRRGAEALPGHRGLVPAARIAAVRASWLFELRSAGRCRWRDRCCCRASTSRAARRRTSKNDLRDLDAARARRARRMGRTISRCRCSGAWTHTSTSAGAGRLRRSARGARSRRTTPSSKPNRLESRPSTAVMATPAGRLLLLRPRASGSNRSEAATWAWSASRQDRGVVRRRARASDTSHTVEVGQPRRAAAHRFLNALHRRHVAAVCVGTARGRRCLIPSNRPLTNDAERCVTEGDGILQRRASASTSRSAREFAVARLDAGTDGVDLIRCCSQT